MKTIDRIIKKLYEGIPIMRLLIDVKTMADVIRADELSIIRSPDIPISKRTYEHSKEVMDYFSRTNLLPYVKRRYSEKIFEDCMLVMISYELQQHHK